MHTWGPTSQGCGRIVGADATWIYGWAETWSTTQGRIGRASGRGTWKDPGTMVLVVGDDPAGTPQPFEYKARYPVLKRVELPRNPYDVPPGTNQQEMWDRLRQQRPSR